MIARNDQSEPEETPQDSGGQGDQLEKRFRSDAVLLERAIRKDWPVTPEIRQVAIERVVKVLETSTKETNVIRAANTIMTADGINVRREQIETPQQHEHIHGHIVEERRDRLAAIGERIGTGNVVDAVSNGETNGDSEGAN